MENKIAALITTDKKGVFMGYINPNDESETTIQAEQVKMCIYWSEDVKGVIGLAADGPNENCRITKAAPKATLQGVTAVVTLSEKAEEAWKKDCWSS